MCADLTTFRRLICLRRGSYLQLFETPTSPRLASGGAVGGEELFQFALEYFSIGVARQRFWPKGDGHRHLERREAGRYESAEFVLAGGRAVSQSYDRGRHLSQCPM